MTVDSVQVDDAKRKNTLSAAVSKAVQQGARVEYHNDYSAVVVFGSKPNHVLHALVTLLTAGLWVIGWITRAIVAKEKRVLLEVHVNGRLEVKDLRH